MNDLSAVHAVPGEPIGVPCENPIGSSLLDNFQHSGELGSPGLFCGFGLAERGDDFQLFVCGILLQLTELRIDGENLTIILFRGFPSIGDDSHGNTVSEKPAVGGRKGTRCSGKPRLAGARSRKALIFAIGGAPSKKSEPISARIGAATENSGAAAALRPNLLAVAAKPQKSPMKATERTLSSPAAGFSTEIQDESE